MTARRLVAAVLLAAASGACAAPALRSTLPSPPTTAQLAEFWEAPADLEARTARLLPGLLLARVDGKSPVEYVTDEADRMRVRRLAAMLLEDPVRKLSTVSAAWRKGLEA